MPQTVESEILAELERAELTARERRLAAQAQADRILAEAHRTADEIAAGLDARLAAELGAFRTETLERARTEAAGIEHELTQLAGPEGRVEGNGTSPARTPGFEAAVDDVVAAILSETGPEG